MGSEQRWRWAGIVSVIGVAGVLISDIIGNVIGGYITDTLKNWQVPEQATAATGGAMVASVQGAAPPRTENEAASGPLVDGRSEPELSAETVAAREPPLVPEPDMEANSIPEPHPGPPPQPAVLHGSVEKVLDTATLRVAGEIVLLDGVEGLGSPYRDQLAKFIEEQGSAVRCLPSGMRHTCYVRDVDLALAALTNGAARLSSDATEKYREAEEDARRNRRGIFQ